MELQSGVQTSGFLEVDGRQPVTVEKMKQIEDKGEEFGISKNMMMEVAGSSLALFIFQNANHFRDKSNDEKIRVLLVAGTGNNGGDTFVAARHLAYWNEIFDISLVLLGRSEDVNAKEANLNLQILHKIPAVKMEEVYSDLMIASFSAMLNIAEVVVVGIFGTGFKGEPRLLQKNVIEMINKNTRAVKISVDLPSGLEADSGDSKCVVRSDFTITMHAPKLGMVAKKESRNLCGRILIANIGVPV